MVITHEEFKTLVVYSFREIKNKFPSSSYDLYPLFTRPSGAAKGEGKKLILHILDVDFCSNKGEVLASDPEKFSFLLQPT